MLIHCKVTFFICNIKAFCVIEMHSRRLLYISWNYLVVCDINVASQTDALLNSAILQFFNTYWLKKAVFHKEIKFICQEIIGGNYIYLCHSKFCILENNLSK